AIDTAAFSISNMFRPGNVALDIFGDKETSDARRRCQPDPFDSEGQDLFDLHLRVAIMYTLVYGGLMGTPFCRELVEPLMDSIGHPLSLVFDDADPSDDTPWGLAKTYFDEIDAWMTQNDGWNADGSANRDYNKIPFSDYATTDSEGNSWTPYTPKNSPWKLSKPKRWQPLMDSNNLGYISSQEHVTPYIGATARYFGFNSSKDENAFASRELDNPEYNYRHASVNVLEKTWLTAEDDFMQSAVVFFDNKFGSLVPLKILYFLGVTDTLTALDFYRITVEVQLAIYNGIILTWKEKVRHDLPRPPTVIAHKLGDEEFETYAGPGEGVQMIKASEWEPLIRTMPHSEFPSASACICKVYAEQIMHFLGTDEIDPPLQTGPPLTAVPMEFSSWSEISETCADSRVWGGMHFADATAAGGELCGGGLLASSISSSISALIDGDETAAIFKKDVGELMVRPVTPGSARKKN
ncbi:unnamed protein product, partial [Ascophyllum nodosum]